MTAERDKLRKAAAAAEENVSRLEADLREARDAQTNTSELEAELKAARDRITTLEATIAQPTGDADADALRAKVAQLETKVAANDKAMAEAGKRFKSLRSTTLLTSLKELSTHCFLNTLAKRNLTSCNYS